MSIEQIRERSQKTGDFISQEEEDIIELLSIIDSRIPGTYEKGDRVRLRALSHVQGVVTQDNRKDGGRNVWVRWDHDDHMSCEASEIISVEAGR